MVDHRAAKAENRDRNAAAQDAGAQRNPDGGGSTPQQRNQDRSGATQPPESTQGSRTVPEQRDADRRGPANQQPSEGAHAAAQQRTAEGAQRPEGATRREPSGTRPTPEFQHKLDEFRAQKEAKQDAGQMLDHRAAKAPNPQKVEGAAPQQRVEAPATQRLSTDVRGGTRQSDTDQVGPRQAAADKTVPRHTTVDQTASKHSIDEQSRDDVQNVDHQPGSAGDGNDGNTSALLGARTGPDRRQHEAQHLDPAHDLRRQEMATADTTPFHTTAPETPPGPGDNGFDPGEHHGELGKAFSPGCHDPEGRFDDKERRIADRLTDDGASVHPRLRDDTVQNKQNPDSMVRASPEDPGTVTEFKTLQSADSAAVQRNILKAGKQVEPYGGGDAVIDGRDVQLTADAAQRGYARAVGQARDKGMPLPNKVTVIIGDGSLIVFPEERARV